MRKSSLLQRRILAWLTGALSAVLLTGTLQPQRTTSAALEVTTQERLESEPWWPTMTTAPLKAYAGSDSCKQCHDEGSKSTAMQRAATPGDQSTFLSKAITIPPQSSGITYKIEPTPHGLDYSVSSGGHALTQKLAWVIGAGDLGRTFLYQVDGRWQQSEVSFYTHTAALDITTGLGPVSGDGLVAALGQQLTSQEARACFGCHTVHATTSSGLEPLHAEPGIGCEACHGPARQHVTNLTSSPAQPSAAAVFNPANLSPEDSIDFCGSCHRSSADAKLSVTQDFRLSVVRFQPYRLQESKCWRATKDQRLTCVACHNPHKPLNRDPVSYDRQCLQCHAASASSPAPLHATLVCPRATSNCVTCHMPKVAVPSMHGEFTDHYIRIARAGELIPR